MPESENTRLIRSMMLAAIRRTVARMYRGTRWIAGKTILILLSGVRSALRGLRLNRFGI